MREKQREGWVDRLMDLHRKSSCHLGFVCPLMISVLKLSPQFGTIVK